MCFSCKQEDYWMLWIIDNLTQAIKICKQQVCTFIGSEATAESDYQCIRIDTSHELYHKLWITLILQPCFTDLLLNIFE